MKFEDLKEGQEVYLKVVIVSIVDGSPHDESFAAADLVVCGANTFDNSHAEIYLHEEDFHLLDVKPLTKAQRNAKVKEHISNLKKQLKQAESELIK